MIADGDQPDVPATYHTGFGSSPNLEQGNQNAVHGYGGDQKMPGTKAKFAFDTMAVRLYGGPKFNSRKRYAVSKDKLGTKRICPETERKFYDLNKDPVVSPYTGKSYPLSYFVELASTTKVKKSSAKAKPEEEEEDETEDEVENEDEDADEDSTVEIVSLEDADDDDDDDNDEITTSDDVTDDDIPEIPDVELDDDDEEAADDDIFLEEDDEDAPIPGVPATKDDEEI